MEDIEIIVEASSDAKKGEYFTINLDWKDDHEKPGEVQTRIGVTVLEEKKAIVKKVDLKKYEG